MACRSRDSTASQLVFPAWLFLQLALRSVGAQTESLQLTAAACGFAPPTPVHHPPPSPNHHLVRGPTVVRVCGRCIDFMGLHISSSQLFVASSDCGLQCVRCNHFVACLDAVFRCGPAPAGKCITSGHILFRTHMFVYTNRVMGF